MSLDGKWHCRKDLRLGQVDVGGWEGEGVGQVLVLGNDRV